MPEGYAVKVKPEKVAAVEEIKAELEASQAAVITEYRGLTVQQLAELRTKLLETESSYKVSKNTLVRRAVSALGLGELEELLVGPTAVVYVKGDPIAAAKVISTFAKQHPALVVKGGVLDGRVLSEDQTKGLATVDSLDVSRAKIAGMLVAPLQQIVMLLEAPTARILFVLDELAKRGTPESQAEATEDGEAATDTVPDVENATGSSGEDAVVTETSPEADAEAAAPAQSADTSVDAEATPAGAEAPAEEPAAEQTSETGSTEEGEQS
jgi:large subunit ribosomal protein L10